jgi:hypothetical protein
MDWWNVAYTMTRIDCRHEDRGWSRNVTPAEATSFAVAMQHLGRNLAVAGGLTEAYVCCRVDGIEDGMFLANCFARAAEAAEGRGTGGKT